MRTGLRIEEIELEPALARRRVGEPDGAKFLRLVRLRTHRRRQRHEQQQGEEENLPQHHVR